MALGRANINADTAFAAVGLLDHKVDQTAAVRPEQTGCHQGALGVTGFRVFDLDHVGSPVSQNGTGCGNKGPACHFEYAYTFQR